jgi:circadian clock protein KaiB
MAGERQDLYVLRLYVTGRSPNSTARDRQPQAHLRGPSGRQLPARVIDLYQQPELARGQQIIAAPTLIKELPEPMRRILGDLSNEERVLAGLDVRRVGG